MDDETIIRTWIERDGVSMATAAKRRGCSLQSMVEFCEANGIRAGRTEEEEPPMERREPLLEDSGDTSVYYDRVAVAKAERNRRKEEMAFADRASEVREVALARMAQILPEEKDTKKLIMVVSELTKMIRESDPENTSLAKTGDELLTMIADRYRKGKAMEEEMARAVEAEVVGDDEEDYDEDEEEED